MKIGSDIPCRYAMACMVELSILAGSNRLAIAFMPFAWTVYMSWNPRLGMAYAHVGPFSILISALHQEPRNG